VQKNIVINDDIPLLFCQVSYSKVRGGIPFRIESLETEQVVPGLNRSPLTVSDDSQFFSEGQAVNTEDSRSF
jgi:hypothetical protein